MKTQTDDLVLIAIGVGEHQESLWDDRRMEPGIHLRWAFRTELGFPLGGFDLYRREHPPGDPDKFKFSDPIGKSYSSPWNPNRHLIFTSTDQLRISRLNGQKGLSLDNRDWLRVSFTELVSEVTIDIVALTPVAAIAYHNFATVAHGQADGTGTLEKISLGASAMDAVEIERADGLIVGLSWIPGLQLAQHGWGAPLNIDGPISLPITVQPDYPITHQCAPDDRAEAAARLPEGVWNRLAEDGWEDLKQELKFLVRDDLPVPMAYRLWSGTAKSQVGPSPGTVQPEMTYCPMQQVVASALNHNLARVLRLYWIDDTAEENKTYDYRIVGHWARAGRATCPTARYVDFRYHRKGTIVDGYLEHENGELTFVCPSGLKVIATAGLGGVSETQALHIGYLREFGPSRLEVLFTGPVDEVQLRFRTAAAKAEVAALDENNQRIQWEQTATEETFVTLQAPGICRVQVTGLDLHLFSICYLRPEDEPGDRAWILRNVRRGEAPRLEPPSGLRADLLPGMATLQPDGTPANGTNALGVRWDLPVEQGSLAPGKPIMYLVQQAELGTGLAAEEPDPVMFKSRDEGPVVVTLPDHWTVVDHGTVSVPSQWDVVDGTLRQTTNIFGGSLDGADLPKPGTYALAGRWEWTDYQFIVSLESEDDDAIGVVFRYQDEKNFYRFSMDRERRYRRLVKCVKGTFSRLQEVEDGFDTGRTYQIRVVARGHHLKVWIDSQLLFDVTDGDLSHGRVGLYAWGNPGAIFHWVRVSSPSAKGSVFFHDDFRATSLARLPQGWPAYSLYLLNQGLPDGWYGYRVAPIDLFGRLGPFSSPCVIRALDRTPPASPVVLKARILQPRPLDAPESIMDKTLSEQERNWLENHPEGGMKVEWVWPGEMRLNAPDAAEFRLYFHPGQGNTIAGWITDVQPEGSQFSRLTTDRNTTLPPDAFRDQRVRVGTNEFVVVGSTSGNNFTLKVKNIENPEAATNTAVPKWITPLKAGFALTLSPRHPHHVDYRRVEKWSQRLHVEPVGEIPTLKGTITGRAMKDDGTYTLMTDQALSDPATGIFPDGRVVAGVLFSSGEIFQATKHTPGLNTTVTVWPLAGEVGDLVPDVGDPFVYYPGYRYSTILTGPLLNPTSYDPVAYGLVGVSCADDKKHSTDRYPGGKRQGNEGAVSSPHTVFAVHREPPQPLKDPPDSERVYAESADYYGHSHYTLSWRAAGDGTFRYQVYRALDDSVFASDKRFLPVRQFDPGMNPGPVSDSRWPSVAQELSALQAENPDYESVSNDALQVLASLPGNADAFSLLTPNPLSPEDLERPTPDMLGYTDTLNGRARNRYFYRVAVVDRAGNRSLLGPSSPPIYLPDTMPPRAPVPVKALGGERQVTLTWQANREPGMTHYLVYRTTDKHAVEDIRMMGQPVTTVPHPANTNVVAQVSYKDQDLPGPRSYYYRLVAVRQGQVGPQTTIELASPPSRVIAARNYDLTPPTPPTWTRAEWVLVDKAGQEHPWGSEPPVGETYTPVVALEWSSTASYVRWIVQRKVKDTELWHTVSPWLDAVDGERLFFDKSASAQNSHVYRIQGVDISGRVNIAFSEQEVAHE